jgi:rhamnogalacturonan endolyase
MKKLTTLTMGVVLFLLFATELFATKRPMEYLNRGLVAVKVTSGVYLSWRFLGTDTTALGFNIYRNDVLVNSTPITTSTNYTDASGTTASVYKVVPVLDGVEDTTGVKSVTPWSAQYKSLKLNRPANSITEPNKYGSVGSTVKGRYPSGQPYGYSPNDCSVGDLDGDGEYEIVVKWDPTNSQDNSYYGITGPVYLDAYKLDGTQLWRISLGKNIRAGAHYTQFLVYDFDGDGLAEVICKTAPGTIDGAGNYVIMNSDDPTSDYRSLDTTQISGSKMLGTVLSGSEYLTLFDGKTGAELNSVAYDPPRGSLSSWGDSYGNRSERYLACVAYLNGVIPSAIMCRGYYYKTTLAAYNVVNKKLVEQWLYNSGTTSGVGAYGQGNHNLSVADVDNDGCDEIIYGSCAFDQDGTLLYRTGLGHGDAMHLSDLNPNRDGLEVFEVHEETSAAYGFEMHDAKTGTILWGTYTGTDVGRGCAADLTSSYSGFETWNDTYVKDCLGDTISTRKPSINFRIYWDGDLQDELLDNTSISKWSSSSITTLLSPSGLSSCNSTKATPCLSADLFGDWREEVIWWQTSDSATIRIYTTTTATSYRLFTLMHDPVYRLGIAWQNTAYNQPPHLGVYIGGGLSNVSQPNITTIKYTDTSTAVKNVEGDEKTVIYSCQGTLKVNSSENIQSVSVYSVLGVLVHLDNKINSTEYSYSLPDTNPIYIVKVKTSSGINTVKVHR